MKKRIGIVSSFNVLCGNATYSQELLDGIPDEFEAVQIEVPVELQKRYDAKIVKRIIQKVQSCDAVNIQMELGLYGSTPRSAAKFVKKIIKNSKKASMTMHRVEKKPLALVRVIYNGIKAGSIKEIIKSIFVVLVELHLYKISRNIILFAYHYNATFIVHTGREQTRVNQICLQANVITHPIIWPKNLGTGKKIDLISKFKNDYPIIGLFGFVSSHKNFEQVFRTVLNIGEHNLLLAGGMHPYSNQYGKEISPSKNKLSQFKIDKMIKKEHLSKTYILTAPDDDSLVDLIRSVDVIVIPYFETGQSASGIASLAIQYGKQVIFSDTFLATELIPFLNQRPYLFDVNFDLSLIYAIKDSLNCQQKKSLKFDGFDFNTNINIYLTSLGLKESKK